MCSMKAATSEPMKFSPSPRPTTSGELRRAATTRDGSWPSTATRVKAPSRRWQTCCMAVVRSAPPCDLELEQVRGDLGVGLREHLVAGVLEPGAQRGEVLDDAVVHDRDPAGPAQVRVRVARRWGRRGWPSGCGRCRWWRRAAGSRRWPSRGWPACPCACRRRSGRRPRRCRRARCRRSRSRGTPASAGPRSRRPAPACHRRSPRFRTWAGVYASVPVPSASAAGATILRMSAAGAAEREGLPGASETSPYVELDRSAWAALARETENPLSPEEVDRLRGLGDALDLDEVEQVYLPLSRLLSAVRRLRRSAAPRAGGVPAPPAAAAHAVRDRPRRLGGGRQVHHRPRAPADAGPLARAPQRRAGHHRRLPAPQRRARAPRDPAPQGLPGVLRPQGPAALRRRHQVRQGRGRGPDLLPPRLRRGPRREGRRQAPRHRDHRGPQRPPAGAGARRRPAGLAVSDFFDFSVYVDAAVGDIKRWYVERFLRLRETAFRDPLSYFRKYAMLSEHEATAEAGRIWDTINGPNLARERRRPPAPGPPWCCARTPTTRCATCGCASSDAPTAERHEDWLPGRPPSMTLPWVRRCAPSPWREVPARPAP